MTDDGWRSTGELEREQTGEVPEIFLPKRIFPLTKTFPDSFIREAGEAKKVQLKE